MKFIRRAPLMLALAAAQSAHAIDFVPIAPAASEVRVAKLATVCDACGVVTGTRVETRSGEGTAVGTVGGAVVGGVIGHQIGSGNGRTAATVLGAIGGGVAGHAIDKEVKKKTVWLTTVAMKDGSTRTFEQAADPALQAGDVVKIDEGRPVKQPR